ncbi:MAG: DNA-directed RNA polymerase subunit H [Euryarchaeota archaeon]|nr:DNA-directed RNA polymerase subunit H [Euryarchaeota archaeon]
MPQKFDVMKHALVPRHEIVSQKEFNELMTRYKIVADQLPKILTTDPVVKAIKAKPGQLVRIKRDSQTAGQAIAYRLVVEG